MWDEHLLLLLLLCCDVFFSWLLMVREQYMCSERPLHVRVQKVKVPDNSTGLTMACSKYQQIFVVGSHTSQGGAQLRRPWPWVPRAS
jgi:hypothetical protein